MSTRIAEKNKYFLLLKNAENIIKKNIETIKRYNLIEQTEYISNSIKKLKLQNEEKEKYISELKIKIEKISSGELDKDIIRDTENNKKILDSKNNEKNNKKKIHLENVKSQKNILDIHYKDEKKYNNYDKYDKNDHNRSYNYFLKTIDSLPNYILNNLEKMPNNKGYIWKSIHFYGLLDSDNEKKITMTEKLYNNVTRIHEWNEYEHIIYTKNKNIKTIISTNPRKKFN